MKHTVTGFLMGITPAALVVLAIFVDQNTAASSTQEPEIKQIISTEDFVTIGCYRVVAKTGYRVGYFENDEYKELYLSGRTNVIREGMKERTPEGAMIEIETIDNRSGEVNIILHGEYAIDAFKEGCSLGS